MQLRVVPQSCVFVSVIFTAGSFCTANVTLCYFIILLRDCFTYILKMIAVIDMHLLGGMPTNRMCRM